MKRLGWIIVAAAWIILGRIPSCEAQIASLTGDCTQGATQAAVSGLKSTNYQQGMVPSCLVTVYLTGTTTKATLYADALGTTLTNPFTATTKGRWLFYSANASCYDVVLGGGTSPNAYPAPVTLTAQCSNAPQPANVVNINSIVPYADLGAAVEAADNLFAGFPVTINTNIAGTVSTIVTLSPMHNWHATQSFAIVTAPTLGSTTSFSCAPGVTITSSVAAATGLFNAMNGATNVDFGDNCTISSTSGSPGIALVINGISNSRVHGIYGDKTFIVQTTGITNNLEVDHNKSIFPLGVFPGGDAVVRLTGPVRNSWVHHNYFYGGPHHVEFFGLDAANNPSLAALQAYGLQDDLVSDNISYYPGSQVGGQASYWGSGMYRVKFVHNFAYGAGDYCFDYEGSANTGDVDSTTELCANGHHELGYSVGYGNYSINANATARAGGEVIFGVHNVSGDPSYVNDVTIQGGIIRCYVLCTLLGGDTATNTHMSGVDALNGAVPSLYEQPGQILENNILRYTLSLSGDVGMGVGGTLNGATSIGKGNIISTTVAQSGYCMGGQNNDFSNSNTTDLEDNKCYGPWAGSITMSDTNVHVPQYLTYRGNLLPNLTPSIAGFRSNSSNNCLLNGGCDTSPVGVLSLGGLPLTQAATAPTGLCTTVGFVLSNDGHMTYCNGTTNSLKF